MALNFLMNIRCLANGLVAFSHYEHFTKY